MASGLSRTFFKTRSPCTLLIKTINIIMVRIAVFLGNEEIFLLLFELMISQVFKPFGTLQCWTFSLNSANSAAVFSYLFVLLARSSPHEPRIHDQGLLVPGLSENTNTVYFKNSSPFLTSAIKLWIIHTFTSNRMIVCWNTDF